MRNPSIELFRYVFAFLVVTIHVSLAHGGMFLMPLARCGVPFFYLVSGYFLAKKMGQQGDGGGMCLRSARKWIAMWGRYIVVFAVLGVLIDWYCGDVSFPQMSDAASLALHGQCLYIDEHIINSQRLGLLTLWFLYDGALAFGVLYLMRKHLRSKWLLLLIVALQLVSAVCQHEGLRAGVGLTYASIPYIYYGVWLGRSDALETYLSEKRHYTMLLVMAGVLYLCSMVEYKLMGDVEFANIPLSVLLFLLVVSGRTGRFIVRITPPLWLRSLQNSTPYTLDVYIWHRFVYVLIVMVGINCYGCDAIVAFVVTLLASFVIRKGRQTLFERK